MKFLHKIFRFPFFGLLVGFFPLISLWNNNKTQIYSHDVNLSLLITAVFVVVVWILFALIFRSPLRASIAASLFFLLIFSYGHVYNMVKDETVLGISFGFKKLLVVYLVLLVISVFVTLRTRKIPEYLVLMLNGILSLLILFNLVQIALFEGKERVSPVSAPINTLGKNVGEYPDIYYIILDAYSRQDVLLDYMNYDNTEFINALSDMGFYVADCSNSNYSGTLASMVSSLNYSFFDANEDVPLELSNNKMRLFLANYGYKFVTSKGFSSENDIPDSDIYLNYLTDSGTKDTIGQSQFTRLYFETTILRVFFEMYYMDPVKNDFLPQWLFVSEKDDKVLGYASFWYNQTRYVIDSIEKIPEAEGNYFVYAHINAPHGPYVFDRNGGFKYTYNPDDNIPYYVDAVVYINKRILHLVENLISKSSSPPIIIIQGDHGAHVITSGLDKHKILNAYYFPEKAQASLNETITPVNTFRILLRDYFNQDVGLLPDSVFVETDDGVQEVLSSCEVP